MALIDLLKKNFVLSSILLLVVFTVIRVAFINADVSQDLSKSAAIYTDEGFKTYASRNRALYGNWKWALNDAYAGWVKRSPVSVWSYFLLFRFFGVSMASIRSLSILYSLLTLILLVLFVRKYYGDRYAILSMLLFGFSFFNIMFNRLGLYESHLNFYYLCALLAFSKALSDISSKKNIRSVMYSVLIAVIGLCALIISYYVKSSLFIIALALCPALIIVVCDALRPEYKIKVFNIILSIIASGYLLIAHILPLFENVSDLLLNTKIFTINLALLVHSKIFDILPVMLAKSLHIEFIILQPVLFFLCTYYSIVTFYNYIYNRNKHIMDLFLSSWFLFGFILLTLLSYHPARYYILLMIPMVILSSRALLQLHGLYIKQFISETKPFVFRFLTALFYYMAIIYAAISLITLIIPVSIRNILVKTVYNDIINKTVINSLPCIIVAVFLFTIIVSIIFLTRKRVLSFICNIKKFTIFLAIILALQLFQYGKWLLFHEKKQYNLSKKIGEILPANAVLVGGWSAGLVLENSLRALIIQDSSTYNYSVIRRLLQTNKILVNTRNKNIAIMTNLPVYLVISPEVIFEKYMFQELREFIDFNNLVIEEQFGFFNLKIYKLINNSTKL